MTPALLRGRTSKEQSHSFSPPPCLCNTSQNQRPFIKNTWPLRGCAPRQQRNPDGRWFLQWDWGVPDGDSPGEARTSLPMPLIPKWFLSCPSRCRGGNGTSTVFRRWSSSLETLRGDTWGGPVSWALTGNMWSHGPQPGAAENVPTNTLGAVTTGSGLSSC